MGVSLPTALLTLPRVSKAVGSETPMVMSPA
jgi:hypothetical protein